MLPPPGGDVLTFFDAGYLPYAATEFRSVISIQQPAFQYGKDIGYFIIA
jgi:hypothetical protein